MWEQKKLIRELLKKERFVLIILDACRFDIFDDLIDEYLEEIASQIDTLCVSCFPTYSPASCTDYWLKEVFPDFYEVTYYSANPFVNPKVPVKGYDAKKHFAEIVFAWKEWDRRLYTVPPKKVNEIVLSHKPKYPRIIVHYLQPHLPPCFEHPYLKYLRTPPPGYGADIFFFDLVRKGIITIEEYKRLYIENLRHVLDAVVELILKLDYDYFVVTADHGELLGERGLIGHPAHIECRELRLVPWLEVFTEKSM